MSKAREFLRTKGIEFDHDTTSSTYVLNAGSTINAMEKLLTEHTEALQKRVDALREWIEWEIKSNEASAEECFLEKDNEEMGQCYIDQSEALSAVLDKLDELLKQ